MKHFLLTICFGLLFSTSFAIHKTTIDSVITIKDLDAKSKVAYFSLATGKEVKETDAWDLAFSATTIKLNGTTTASKKVAVATLKGTTFEKVDKAPETGFQEDTQSTSGIPSGSGNGWYTYDMGTHQVLPIADRVFVVRSNTGLIYKLQVQSYYLNQDEAEETGYYTFKYAAINAK